MVEDENLDFQSHYFPMAAVCGKRYMLAGPHTIQQKASAYDWNA